MPSKSYFMNDLPLGAEKSRFKAIYNYAISNHNVTGIVSLTYVNGGIEKIRMKNSSEEEFVGQGMTKMEAIADCISAKYPA